MNRDKQNIINSWEFIENTDPFWGILTAKGKKNNRWQISEFYKTGIENVNELFESIDKNSVSRSIRTVLDFGCGAGRISNYLTDKFDRVIGFDISHNMLKIAVDKLKHKNNIIFIQSFDTNLSYLRSTKIDLIISFITFQNLPQSLQIEYIKNLPKV